MANSLFDKGREGFATGDIQWDSDDIRVMLVKSTYTYDGTDQFLADMGSVDNGRSAALGSKTTTSGICDAADTSITATSAVACNALVLFVHTGSDATAKLIGYIDTATGLPVTPSASQVFTVAWSNATNKIVKI